MENIIMEGTGRTPAIKLDAENGFVEISGRSIPENSISFYKPVFDWLDEYSNQAKPLTEVVFNLEYFNTSSSKCILDILRKLEQLPENGNPIAVKWYYEDGDEDMEESGNDFKSLINIDIELVVK
ncbi:MAG: DUF1987 domain-containing protein [Bacteroidetes bacterium]|nr:MAG: DUF1987 domain-containing protein [Bacteroidota bacterium]TAG89848.1 MAG: DUF1987 domain-containing protein [Bacteroidota bacterium]